ncbi:MAG: hypothetical protein ACT4NL_17695 [Pseudomarimonas sp.]
MDSHSTTQWWLRLLGNTLIWARLQVRESGTAEVFDCDARQLPYDSEDSARAALLDAEFVALDGLDGEDAAQMGLHLETLRPPAGEGIEALREQMIQTLSIEPFRGRH